MQIRKRNAVIAFAVLFGSIGVFVGCGSAVVSLTDRGGHLLTPLLLLFAVPLSAAAFGAVVGLLFSRLGDPPDPPSSPNTETVP